MSRHSQMATWLGGYYQHMLASLTDEGAYLMRVGVSPRVNAGRPSVRHTVRTQCSVDLYFCPSAAENPSVCMRDFTMSMGYIMAQS